MCRNVSRTCSYHLNFKHSAVFVNSDSFGGDFLHNLCSEEHEARMAAVLCSAAALAFGESLGVSSREQQAQLCSDDGGRPRHWRPGLLRQHHTEVAENARFHTHTILLVLLFFKYTLCKAPSCNNYKRLWDLPHDLKLKQNLISSLPWPLPLPSTKF